LYQARDLYNKLFFLPSPERNIVCFLGLTLNGQLYLRFLVYYFSIAKKEIWTFKPFLGNSKGGFFPTLFSLLLNGISWYVHEVGIDGLF
jgi:hypothetical protein